MSSPPGPQRCSTCGTYAPEGASHCSQCGARIAKNRELNWWLLAGPLGCLALAFGAAGACYIAFSGIYGPPRDPQVRQAVTTGEILLAIAALIVLALIWLSVRRRRA